MRFCLHPSRIADLCSHVLNIDFSFRIDLIRLAQLEISLISGNRKEQLHLYLINYSSKKVEEREREEEDVAESIAVE
jgi:hypothetical protein